MALSYKLLPDLSGLAPPGSLFFEFRKNIFFQSKILNPVSNPQIGGSQAYSLH
jgi:hypothetical protein